MTDAEQEDWERWMLEQEQRTPSAAQSEGCQSGHAEQGNANA